MNPIKIERSILAAAVAIMLFNPFGMALADTTLSIEAIADTFISSDPTYADRDMSAFGAMQISANLPDPIQGISYSRTVDNVIAYDATAIKTGFDTQYGSGNWHVTNVQVKWYTNFDILGIPAHNPQFNVPAAGSFNISLLNNNSWFDPTAASVLGLSKPDFTWNSVFNSGGTYSTLLDNQQILGTYQYTGGDFNGTNNCSNEVCAPRFWDLGSNISLFSKIEGGEFLTLFGSAADENVTYLVNQLTKPGAHPQLFVSAAAGASVVPIPSAIWLFISACLAIPCISKRNTLGTNIS